MRITAQLIDATTGGHLWSERYDRDLSDIFELQSEIAEKIIAAVRGEILYEAERRRLARRPIESLTAYDAYLKGLHHVLRGTRRDNETARQLLARAIELDPDFALALSLLGSTYGAEFLWGWNRDPALLDRTVELALRAIALDPTTYHQPYMSIAFVESIRGNLPEALAAVERAIELAPNIDTPHAVRGLVLARQGDLVGATRSIRRALRLSPRAPTSAVLLTVAYVNFAAGRQEEAVNFMERARTENPELLLPRIALAARYEQEGEHEKARAAAAEILAITPDLTAEIAMEMIPGLERMLRPDEFARYPDNLRKAGLP